MPYAEQYQHIAASQTDKIIGNGGRGGQKGDYLDKLIITVATAASAAVSIEDGPSGASIPILPNSPGGGIGVYTVWLGVTSVNAAWQITTGAGSTVLAVFRPAAG